MEAEQYWRRIRGNSGDLPKLVILPTQLTPSNQKAWMEKHVVRQYASLVYAATKCYSEFYWKRENLKKWVKCEKVLVKVKALFEWRMDIE